MSKLYRKSNGDEFQVEQREDNTFVLTGDSGMQIVSADHIKEHYTEDKPKTKEKKP